MLMETTLRTLFSSYGKIIDVKLKRNLRHRGQAFVSFETVEHATKAMNEVNGFPLFDRPMDIQYAKEQSFAVSERNGSLYDHKIKRKQLLGIHPLYCHWIFFNYNFGFILR